MMSVSDQGAVMWSCMSCGAIGHAQSCAVCGAEAMPGEWMPKDKLEQLHDAATDAVLDALSWMDPETAAKWRAETTYKRLRVLLSAASDEKREDR